MPREHPSQPVSILLHKPYGMLSQFTQPRAGPTKWKTLSDLGPLPKSVYPVGRLDADSEGLLVLTNDNRLAGGLLHPRHHLPRTYLVQVEGIPGSAALELLGAGRITLDGRPVRRAKVRLLPADPGLPPRPVPIRTRLSVPTSWLEMTIEEGRNRQVRRMTAAAGHPALRLVRVRIGPLHDASLKGGSWRFLTPEEVTEVYDILRPRRRAPGPGRTSGAGFRRRGGRR